ncbi:MAG: tRNA (adenosine(37)-N6)-threonylcarbamoyltransferase complex ATPase subunit type 1 TsaE [Galactobacter sp.]|uniref:tRNA (adenosine(37)-N6)-threonylcarbamoyltransferase complex ATPase subunit type 1 TsaE n=1 Tax=Galactobacter sp. TaxID=2676125 RepID=UPI0025BDFBB2|nr:tRNA (adenosine(37)-N6)-threonylcarbamoyltransferase complex ATPase subunit type 1 TsaE [Galactobacter sp.]
MTEPQEESPLATIALPTAEATQALAAGLATVLLPGDLIILVGELGAGKTTFTQGLGLGLGVKGRIASPTFVLSRVHSSSTGGPDLVHVDAYRLGSAAEVTDLDLEESMDRSVTVVEWGRDRAEDLAQSRLEIELIRPVGDAATGVSGGSDGPAPWEAEDLEDDAVERSLRLWAIGPRWEGEARAALLRAVGHEQPHRGAADAE